jgi:hypothetical protein
VFEPSETDDDDNDNDEDQHEVEPEPGEVNQEYEPHGSDEESGTEGEECDTEPETHASSSRKRKSVEKGSTPAPVCLLSS